MIYTEIRNIVYILIRKMVKVMKKAEVVTRLIKEAGYSKRAFAEKIGLPPQHCNPCYQEGLVKHLLIMS